MWGVDGKDGVASEKLKPLGLYCPGGGTKNGKDYFTIYCNEIRYEITKDEFDDIESWLRKLKLEKLNEVN